MTEMLETTITMITWQCRIFAAHHQRINQDQASQGMTSNCSLDRHWVQSHLSIIAHTYASVTASVRVGFHDKGWISQLYDVEDNLCWKREEASKQVDVGLGFGTF